VRSANHWKKALPYYLMASFLFSLIFWVLPLVLVLIGTIWIGLTTHHLVVNRAGLGLGLAFGGGFFLLAFVTAVGADIYRNRGVQNRTIEWNPSLVWKTFVYLGAFFFFVAAFLSYHQGVWLSIIFMCLCIGSAIAARFCFQAGS